jgi:hypothetical protein
MGKAYENPGFVVSGDELVQPADPSFELECMSIISDLAKAKGYQFKISVLTKSKEWGLIWRADFDVIGQSNHLGIVNRVVCWRQPHQDNEPVGVIIGFGQQVSPL